MHQLKVVTQQLNVCSLWLLLNIHAHAYNLLFEQNEEKKTFNFRVKVLLYQWHIEYDGKVKLSE